MNTKLNPGSIEVICGPMFSGKTEALIQRAKEEQFKNQNIQVFKPSIDNRYSNKNVVSHNKNKIECIVINSAIEILSFRDNINIFLIDEAQFFDKEITNVCQKLASKGKKIIIAGLDRDYEAKPFGQMLSLISISNNVTKLKSICSVCKKSAEYSYRITEEINQVLIGEAEKYEPRCKICYYNKKESTKWKD